MKILKSITAMMLILSMNTFAVPEGAFTTLHVKAKNVDKYIEMMKENQPIGRPRQIYTGETERNYTSIEQR